MAASEGTAKVEEEALLTAGEALENPGGGGTAIGRTLRLTAEEEETFCMRRRAGNGGYSVSSCWWFSKSLRVGTKPEAVDAVIFR